MSLGMCTKYLLSRGQTLRLQCHKKLLTTTPSPFQSWKASQCVCLNFNKRWLVFRLALVSCLSMMDVVARQIQTAWTDFKMASYGYGSRGRLCEPLTSIVPPFPTFVFLWRLGYTCTCTEYQDTLLKVLSSLAYCENKNASQIVVSCDRKLIPPQDEFILIFEGLEVVTMRTGRKRDPST